MKLQHLDPRDLDPRVKIPQHRSANPFISAYFMTEMYLNICFQFPQETFKLTQK